MVDIAIPVPNENPSLLVTITATSIASQNRSVTVTASSTLLLSGQREPTSMAYARTRYYTDIRFDAGALLF